MLTDTQRAQLRKLDDEASLVEAVRIGREMGLEEAISACHTVDIVGADECIEAIRALKDQS
jgi:hypothetical protein